ncbi:hypothetical protein M1E11_08665 [Bacillus sp. JZ8]
MFGFEDLPKFFFSFLIVLPLVAITHQLGHLIVAILFGGRVDFTIGRGKTIFKKGKFKIKSVYFLDSFCVYEELKIDNRFTHALVYAGGIIANLASILIMNGLVVYSPVEPSLFSYQFVYFSVYYVALSLLPIKFSETTSSDGRAIYDALRYGKIACNPD